METDLNIEFPVCQLGRQLDPGPVHALTVRAPWRIEHHHGRPARKESQGAQEKAFASHSSTRGKQQVRRHVRLFGFK